MSGDKKQLYISSLTKGLQDHYSDVWKALYPRHYKISDGWGSPISAASVLGESCLQVMNDVDKIHGGTGSIACLSGLLTSYKVPTFFIGHDLFESVQQTKAPEGLTWGDVPFPQKAGLFILPQSNQSNPAWIAWAKLEIGTSVKIPGIWRPLNVVQEMIVMTGHPFSNTFFYTPCVWIPNFKTQVCSSSFNYIDNPDSIENLDFSKFDWSKSITSIVANLFYAMAARPELVERTGVCVRKIKNGPAREEWTPNWIGRTYRIQRPEGDGTHASPRLHWRRGHYRRQPVGAGRKDHKIIWLEPCLVGATETEDAAK